MERPEKPADIVVFVEHVARELDIACAVKYLAEKREGLTVEIASIVNNLQSILARRQPSVVVLPYSLKAAQGALGHIRVTWPNAVYVDLAYEQIFWKHQLSKRAPADAFARRHVLHIAWGDFYAEFLQQYGVLNETILTHGNPSYALYRPPYVSYFEPRDVLARKFGLDRGKRWVFVPENYGAAFSGDHARTVQQFAFASLREAVKWWGRAAEAGRAEVIVRPRPTTPAASLAQACREVLGAIPQSLHIIKDGTVREWILASDMVTSSYSTTLIEASVARKPICVFAPLPFPDSMELEWLRLAPRAESLTEFLEFTEGPVSPSTSEPLRAWAERQMMGSGDPISNLVERLGAICRGEGPIPERQNVGELLLTDRASPTQALYRRSRRFAGLVLRWSGLRRKRPQLNLIPYEMDDFDGRDVDLRVSRWEQVGLT